ncbi:MAG: hypothetical protein DUD27_05450 [Lachnospiraceae bacterium]|uniref:YhgE/Pip domain-containing protein n=1 Tax=Candidatus Weimeria bifida TaxID=2599074 RepID=A0A6N7IX63_9FIRM|nr:hypothetical protein [Candidatus Weimeria bifida]RRF96237.1 MAG: hypothetical protein DUD27_05450 [Lachnospiraceae bacterium]
MKLPELKKIFRKKYIIRVVAGALVVGLVSTSSVQYTALADKAATTEQTTNDIISTDDVKVSNKDIDKDETVYLISKADGTVSDTIVASHLVNKDGADKIEDVADLKNIKNTNGNEKFTQNGTEVTWQANGKDIYYQGHTTKEAPVSVKVTYTLDDKEVKPKDLAGKSGHVKIHYEYTNNSTYTENVNGESVTTVVPFAAITGMVLNDDFTNIKVTNGRVVQNGTKSVVIGYALPGLKDSLEKAGGKFDKDVELPDSLDIEADVKNFDLETQMTAIVDASNTITSSSKSSNTISNDIDKLSDAGDQLKDGSEQLADGTSQLNDGAKKLAGGAKSAKDGSSKLASGTKQLKDGLGTLNSNMGTFKSGASSLSSGLNQYTAGVSKLNGGIGTLRSGLSPLRSQLPALKKINFNDLANQLTALSTGVSQLKSGSDQLLAGYNGDGTAKNPGLVKSMDQLTAGAKSVSDGASSVSSGASSLSDGATKASTGASSVSSGASDVSNGAANVSNGASTLSDSASKLAGGAKSVSDGAAKVDAGIGQLETQLSGLGTQFGTISQEQLTETIDKSLNTNQSLISLLKSTKILTDDKITLANIDGVVTKLTENQTQVIDALAKANSNDTVTATATYYTALDVLHRVQSARDALNTAEQSLQDMLTNETTQKQLKELKDGSAQVANGAKQVSEGSQQLAAGSKQLATGSKSLADGSKNLATGSKSLADGSKTLADGAKQLADGSSTLATGSKTESDGMTQANAGVKQLANGHKQLSDGINELYTSLNNSGISKLDVKKYSSLPTAAETLIDGVDQLYKGGNTLVANNSKLTGGASKLSSGAGQISSGVSRLYSGAGTLFNGQNTLTSGLSTLYDGTNTLADGAEKLTSGADKLHDGIVKLDKEGIEKLVNSYNGDIKPLANQLRAALDAGEDYQSFSGLADGKQGSVQFLYRMDGISKDDD